jgi:hypothetical protein
MKDVFCLATFAIKLLCLVAFVIILKPHGIGTAEAPSKPQYCRMKPVVAQACGPNADAGQCGDATAGRATQESC